MNKKGINVYAKRRLICLTFIILLLISAIIASIFNNIAQVMKNKNELVLLNQEYKELLKEEESLQSEITKLQDSDYVARYAREKYSYSLPGEVIIKLPTDK